MELLQLRYFVKVAETCNITKAAKELYVSQPALSATISRLEKDIGITLFHRGANTLTLTAAGSAFLEQTREALQTLEKGVEQAKHIEKQHKRDVTVSAGLGIVSDIAKEYAEAFPQIKLDLSLVQNAEIARAVSSGKADFGVSIGRLSDPAIEQELLLKGRIFVAVGARQKIWKDRTYIQLSELEGKRLLCSPLAETEKNIRAIFEAHHVPCELLALDEKEFLFDAAVNEMGCVVCVPLLHERQMNRLHKKIQKLQFKMIMDVEDEWEIYLYRKKGKYASPAVNDLIGLIRSRFALNQEALCALTKEILSAA